MAPKILIVIGKSNSGKTRLITKLLPSLIEKGYRVATIKRAKRGFEIDRPGKDSYLHAQAGAEAVLVVSGDRLALIRRLKAEPALSDLVQTHLADFDLVIVEGFKEEDYPKIVILNGTEEEEELVKFTKILALVSDRGGGSEIRRFGSDEAGRIADFIEREILAAK